GGHVRGQRRALAGDRALADARHADRASGVARNDVRHVLERRDRVDRRRRAAVAARHRPGAVRDVAEPRRRAGKRGHGRDLRRARRAPAVLAGGDRRAGAAGGGPRRPPPLARVPRTDIVAAVTRTCLFAGCFLVVGVAAFGCSDNGGKGNGNADGSGPGTGGSSAGTAGTGGGTGGGGGTAAGGTGGSTPGFMSVLPCTAESNYMTG